MQTNSAFQEGCFFFLFLYIYLFLVDVETIIEGLRSVEYELIVSADSLS